MGLYTSDYLKELSTRKQFIFEQKVFSVKNSPANTTFDIFLSHSFLDKFEVQGLYQELTDLGYSVYVDWIVDPHLNRDNVTKESAELVRRRLKSSKTLLLAISTNATLSKWIPWELGYIDGHTNRCAIIPVTKDRVAPKSFKGTEYLALYPFIKKLSGTGDIFIVESEHRYSEFKPWFLDGIIRENKNINIFTL